MATPITWRNVNAPRFGVPAALLRSGGESITRGINSLSKLAGGIAKEQEGIAVSDAVAKLQGATDLDSLGSEFNTQSDILRSRGIDLKGINAANVTAQGLLRDTAEFESDQIASGLSNSIDQNILNNQPAKFALEQQAREAQIARSNSGVSLDNLKIAESNRVAGERARIQTGIDTLRGEVSKFTNTSTDPDTGNKETTIDTVGLANFARNAGLPIESFNTLQRQLDESTRRPARIAAQANAAKVKVTKDATALEFENKKELKTLVERLKLTGKSREESKTSIKSLLDTDYLSFGQDHEKGLAIIDAAFADDKNYPPELILKAVLAGRDYGGELGVNEGPFEDYQNILDSFGKPKKDKTTDPIVESITRGLTGRGARRN